jgi:hypothetical protein
VRAVLFPAVFRHEILNFADLATGLASDIARLPKSRLRKLMNDLNVMKPDLHD